MQAEVFIGTVGYGRLATLLPKSFEDPMNEDKLPLAKLLAMARDGDFLQSTAT